MLSWLVDRPNRMLEKQRYYQNSTKPLWRRSPRASLLLTPYYALFTVTMMGSVYGAYDLVFGKPVAKE
ncbi:hypothetical protein PILCRDRAFT_826404 [Piloderma croceum F 1598]|uniref:Uncharacterized protein n=1 Tax=Piloderma croceum (strain F 1598) TaxID=765440 RepID=A0A0C3EV42_PILCF|nr:hypothetical protein PILCRDRAFT_826404 [Piloderma croceum F 1598]